MSATQGNKYRQSPFAAMTQQDVAALLGVSREHVGKAERRAVRKLREAVEREASAVESREKEERTLFDQLQEV